MPVPALIKIKVILKDRFVQSLKQSPAAGCPCREGLGTRRPKIFAPEVSSFAC